MCNATTAELIRRVVAEILDEQIASMKTAIHERDQWRELCVAALCRAELRDRLDRNTQQENGRNQKTKS